MRWLLIIIDHLAQLIVVIDILIQLKNLATALRSLRKSRQINQNCIDFTIGIQQAIDGVQSRLKLAPLVKQTISHSSEVRRSGQVCIRLGDW